MTLLRQLGWHLRAAWRLRGYEPQRVTLGSLARWVSQFPREYRADLIRLAASIRFVTREQTVQLLVDLNAQVLGALSADGVRPDQLIYIETDSAGSSSGVMLNLLRDHANLERRGATFLHSRDGAGIQEKTTEIGYGALIYVDDFAGTGKQFVRSRTRVAEYMAGSFSEFFLLPCICEEALSRVEESGVAARAGFIHKRFERPLLEECDVLSPARREQLVDLSRGHWGRRAVSLGFDGLATNVVFYRNAPNTTPLLFRGHMGQEPLQGIVPRFDDLGGQPRRGAT